MLKPISFEVVRQALRWHDFPQPAIRQLSYYEWDSYYSAEYLLIWRVEDVPPKLRAFSWSNDPEDWYRFEIELQECFCTDLRVIKLVIDADREHVKVVVNVELLKQPQQLDLFEADDLSTVDWLPTS